MKFKCIFQSVAKTKIKSAFQCHRGRQKMKMEMEMALCFTRPKKKEKKKKKFECHFLMPSKKGWHQGTRIGFHMVAAIADFFFLSGRGDLSDNSDHIETRDVKNKIMLKKKQKSYESKSTVRSVSKSLHNCSNRCDVSFLNDHASMFFSMR